MKINHGLENDFDVVIRSMKSRKDASMVKRLWGRVQQVIGIYESMLDSKVQAALKDAEKATEEEKAAAINTDTDSPKEEE